MLPSANRKYFLSVHCQKIDVQSYFIVAKHVFLIGFFLTIRKALDTQLNLGWDSANNKQTMYFVFAIKNRHKHLSGDNGKTTRKEMSKLFLCDYLTAYNGMMKCQRNVNFEKIDTERSIRKFMDFDYYAEYLGITSSKILLWQC